MTWLGLGSKVGLYCRGIKVYVSIEDWEVKKIFFFIL